MTDERRQCEQAGCPTRLSMYTGGTLCLLHARAAERAEFERVSARLARKDANDLTRLERGTGRWSVRWDECQGCGTRERPHHSRGLCHACRARRTPVQKAVPFTCVVCQKVTLFTWTSGQVPKTCSEACRKIWQPMRKRQWRLERMSQRAS